MRPIPTHVLTFRGLCVFLLVTTVSPAKADEPIEVPFGADSREPNERRIPLDGVIHVAMQWLDVCGGGDSVHRYHYCNNLIRASRTAYS